MSEPEYREAEPAGSWEHELLAADTTAPYRDALAAIDEALTLPYPATIRDAEVRDGIMLLRVMHTKTLLNGLGRGPAPASLAWQIGYFREQIAKHPAAGYVTAAQAQQALDEGATWSEAVDPARHGIPSETEAADQVPAITFTAPDLMASALDQIEAIGTRPEPQPAAKPEPEQSEPDDLTALADDLAARGAKFPPRVITECAGFCVGVCFCSTSYTEEAARARLAEARTR